MLPYLLQEFEQRALSNTPRLFSHREGKARGKLSYRYLIFNNAFAWLTGRKSV